MFLNIFERVDLYAQLLYSFFVFMIVWRAISVKSKKKTAGNFRKMYATFERCTKLTVKSLKD